MFHKLELQRCRESAQKVREAANVVSVDADAVGAPLAGVEVILKGERR